MLCGGLAFLYAMRADIRVLNRDMMALSGRLELVEKRLGDVTQILAEVARQEVRLNYHEKKLDDLSRGEGFKLPIYKSPYEHGQG